MVWIVICDIVVLSTIQKNLANQTNFGSSHLKMSWILSVWYRNNNKIVDLLCIVHATGLEIVEENHKRVLEEAVVLQIVGT